MPETLGIISKLFCQILMPALHFILPFYTSFTDPDLAWGSQGQHKAKPIGFFSHTLLIWSGWNLMWWWSISSWTSWDYFWVRFNSFSTFPAISLGFTLWGGGGGGGGGGWDLCIYDCFCFFKSKHRGSQIPSLWMVNAGCVFVADIHPSRTWTSGSFESVWWNACVHSFIGKSF